jgi:hypothetical protein
VNSPTKKQLAPPPKRVDWKEWDRQLPKQIEKIARDVMKSIRSRNARRLDVDEVLARSLPKASGNVFRLSANEESILANQRVAVCIADDERGWRILEPLLSI